jgi:hypothetical protein
MMAGLAASKRQSKGLTFAALVYTKQSGVTGVKLYCHTWCGLYAAIPEFLSDVGWVNWLT